MDALRIEVCVCSACVMKGAMDIIDSIESLNEVRDIVHLDRELIIETVGCLGLPNHGKESPIVRVGETVIKNANMETVMACITAYSGNEVMV
jgi:NADH:ubiquinone oxidoreductase subunit E